MKELFYREYSKEFDKKYLNHLESNINMKNLFQLKHKKIESFYVRKYENEFLYFRFKILYEWINNNKEWDRYFVDNLEKNINLLQLNNFLTAEEQNFILFIKSYIFTKSRNIKTLIVDFPIEKDEYVYFHYDQIRIFFINRNKKNNVKNLFELFLSNKRIIFCGYLNIVSFKISDIKKIEFVKSKIIFDLNDYKYEIITNDCKIIEISIKRLFKILKLGDLWE